MLFNSVHFLVFLPVVTVIYFLLAASFYFYCVWLVRRNPRLLVVYLEPKETFSVGSLVKFVQPVSPLQSTQDQEECEYLQQDLSAGHEGLLCCLSHISKVKRSQRAWPASRSPIRWDRTICSIRLPST